jgi:hypothetical protein
VLLTALAAPWASAAEDDEVPPALQAALLAKVAAYDRNLTARAGERVLTLIVSRPKDAESHRVSGLLKEAMASQGPIAELPHVEEEVTLTTPAALAELCRAKKAAVVFVGPGFTDEELLAIASALDGLDLLTVGNASYVRKGVVLGFDLVSGKAKLLVDLSRATKQHVAMSASVLKLMTVYP